MSENKLILDSVCVAASCDFNSGSVKYRGVQTETEEPIFYQNSIANGISELGEFWATVHALAHLKKQGSNIPIYSASETAMLWIERRRIQPNLERSIDTEKSFKLTERALKWLASNDYTNLILRWNIESWGEIPAFIGHEPPHIRVSGSTYLHKQQLKKFGLRWRDGAWHGKFPLSKIMKMEEFCNLHDLQYEIEGAKLKKSRLLRGSRPITNSKVHAVMGEGKLQWEIEETLSIERIRSRKQQSIKQNRKS